MLGPIKAEKEQEIMNNIKALIFDYGGTIDTPAVHWSEVLWQAYQHCQLPLKKEQFREAYVHGERTLARNPFIQPHHNFLDVLLIKVGIEIHYLVNQGYLHLPHASQKEDIIKSWTDTIAHDCYDYVENVLTTTRPILQRLSEYFPMVLVTNFYGNIHTVLDDFRLPFFSDVIESAVVGVRKPDPRIFQLGVEALGLAPDEVAVIGDSYTKDIVPAKSIGCHTVWFKGTGWDDTQHDTSAADTIIKDFKSLEDVLLK